MCGIIFLFANFSYKTGLFKKLLIECCDGCQKRAKIMEEENLEDQEEVHGLDDENIFECNGQNKDAIHEVIKFNRNLAKLYFFSNVIRIKLLAMNLMLKVKKLNFT